MATADATADAAAGFGPQLATLRATFASGKTKSLAWRKWQLKQFWWMLEDNEPAILEALAADLGRHEMETRACDLRGLKEDVLEHLQHVDAWAATTGVPGAGVLFGRIGRSRVRREPLGVVLVIGAWNFPFLLTLQPVIAAVAAGCCVVIKPSELAPASERVMAELVPRYLDPEALRLVTAGPEATARLLDENRFDHIFFTGSARVARFVAVAAARHLTPTTLELGGQCPAVVGRSADLEKAAKRIAFVKFLNAGQICLSVNHVFVDPAVYEPFLARLEHWTREFAAAGHMCHLISERHYDRLAGLLASTRGRVLRAGTSSRPDKYLAAAIVADVQPSDPVMSEELFGPVCPVLRATPAEAIAVINSLPRPLAMYIFSRDRAEIDAVQDQTLSGGVTVNDATLHAGCPGAPFGGVGESGSGYYHGPYGFLAFTHLRTVVELPLWLERVLAMRYPPYDTRNRRYMAIKNRLGFRRGETLRDQEPRPAAQALGRLLRVGLFLAAAGGILYMTGGADLQGRSASQVQELVRRVFVSG